MMKKNFLKAIRISFRDFLTILLNLSAKLQ